MKIKATPPSGYPLPPPDLLSESVVRSDIVVAVVEHVVRVVAGASGVAVVARVEGVDHSGIRYHTQEDWISRPVYLPYPLQPPLSCRCSIRKQEITSD